MTVSACLRLFLRCFVCLGCPLCIMTTPQVHRVSRGCQVKGKHVINVYGWWFAVFSAVFSQKRQTTPSLPGGWAFSFKFSSACEERCRDEITIPLKVRKPSTWQHLKSPVLTACIWGWVAAVVCVGRKDYWQEPVMEWKIEPAVTTVWEESLWNDRED